MCLVEYSTLFIAKTRRGVCRRYRPRTLHSVGFRPFNNCIFYVSRLPGCNLKFIDIHKAQRKQTAPARRSFPCKSDICLPCNCCDYVAEILGNWGCLDIIISAHFPRPIPRGARACSPFACFQFMSFLDYLHFTYSF